MPRAGQIIPQYTHPHVGVYINDNTEYTPQVSDTEQGVRSIHVFASRRGRDNKLYLKKNINSFISEYGMPEFKPYGQAAYLPYGALSTGRSECYCMRVMPADATYSNLVIVAKWAWIEPGQTENLPRLNVSNPDYDPNFGDVKPNPAYPIVVSSRNYITMDKETYMSEFGGKSHIPNPYLNPTTERSAIVTDKSQAYDPSIEAGDSENDARKETSLYCVNLSSSAFVANEFQKAFELLGRAEMGNIQFKADAQQNIPNPKTIEKNIEADLTEPKFHVMYEAKNLNGVIDPNTMLALLDQFRNVETADESGWFTAPMFVAYSQGRGVYGDEFRIRLTHDMTSEKVSEFMPYLFETYIMGRSLKREEAFMGSSLVDYVTSAGKSVLLEDRINDPETGSNSIFIKVSDDISEMFNAYNAKNIEGRTREEASLLKTNVINLINKGSKTQLPYTVLHTESTDYLHLDNIEGNSFLGGFDGAFTVGGSTDVTEEIETMYRKALRGELDKTILSKRRTPADFIYDANYSNETKEELQRLIVRREDAQGFIDQGILMSTTDLQNKILVEPRVGNRLYSFECQHFIMRDPATAKRIPMTTTMELARRLPVHCKTHGIHVPFTGEEYSRITDMVKNELYPVIDADDTELKEFLYNNKINYYEAIGENNYIRGTQTTSQDIWSDLSEENNMRVLLAVKRELETMVSALAYNFMEIEDRKKFTEAADRLLDSYRGMCRSAEVYFESNPFEEERYILHCYLSMSFKSMAKIGLIEIDINPRV